MGDFSNAVDPGRHGSLNAVLLDQADTSPKTWARNWSSVLRFLEQLGKTEAVAVYLLDAHNDLRVIHDYDDEPGHLTVALHQLENFAAPQPRAIEDPAEPSFATRNTDLMRPELLSLGQTRGWANALTGIGEHLSGISGRKALIWLAGSFPNPFVPMWRSVISLDIYRQAMLRAVNELIAADVAIYPVDARGLTTQNSFDVGNENIGIGPGGPGNLSSLPPLPDFSPLLDLASHSGGKAFFNTNGIAESMDEAAAASKGSYTLGFYTSVPADNKFHKIAISVTREGVHLRYRPGYWAFSDAGTSSTRSSEGDLKRALESPFMVRSVGLQATANPTGTVSEEMNLSLYIDSTDLTTSNAGDARSALIDVVFGQKDGTGKVFAIPPYKVPLRISSDAHPWLTTQARLAIRPQSRSVRIVVRDRLSGRLGSLDIPLHLHARG